HFRDDQCSRLRVHPDSTEGLQDRGIHEQDRLDQIEARVVESAVLPGNPRLAGRLKTPRSTSMRKPFRIGSGAGFSGDRLEPACVLAEHGDIDFLALECLGERTIALAQLRKRKNAALGYDPLLERRMDLLLPLLKSHGVRMISNFGAANPLAAADAIVAIARRHKLPIRIAVVTGDDVLAAIEPGMPTLESGTSIDACGELVSANAYLGAEALMPALE